MESFIKHATELAENENPKLLSMDKKPDRNDKETHDIDEELEQLLARQRATIKVVGCGGGGNNTINRMTEVGIVGADTIAINTDAQDLLYTTANKKILIGRELTKGMGAGSEPRLGEEAAREQESEIKKALQGCDMVFVTCGLGGGTGTGSAPVVAEVAKKNRLINCWSCDDAFFNGRSQEI